MNQEVADQHRKHIYFVHMDVLPTCMSEARREHIHSGLESETVESCRVGAEDTA